MTDSPQLPACVVDTSVLIDLHVGRLLRPVFQLPLFLMATDVLIAELQEPDGDLLVDYGLTRVAVIPPLVAAQALERMLESGSRLPWDEREKRLRQWR